MREKTRPSGEEIAAVDAASEKITKGSNRRTFLGQVGSAAAVIAAAATGAGPLVAPAGAAGQENPSDGPSNGRGSRARTSLNNRMRAAEAEFDIRIPEEVTNGDEENFPNRIGNYSKGLVHNGIGEVDNGSYASLLRAVNTGDPRLFEQIQLGGTAPLIDPQAGLAFDLEGTDSHQLAIGTPPSVASRDIADAAVESYWMALCRDVNFTQYGHEPLSMAAIAELNSLPAFHGPSRSPHKTYSEGSLQGTCLVLMSRNFFYFRSVTAPCPSASCLRPISPGSIT